MPVLEFIGYYFFLTANDTFPLIDLLTYTFILKDRKIQRNMLRYI
jgi:hypothetical protein